MKKIFFLFIISSFLISTSIFSQSSEIQIPFEKSYDFYISSDESTMIVPEKNELNIISLSERKVVDKIQTQHQSNITAIAVSHDEKYILTGDMAGEIHLYTMAGDLLKNFTIHSSTIYDLDFHPNESKFISCSMDGKLQVTKYLTESEPILLFKSGKPIYCTSFSNDGKLIAAGFSDGWLRLYENKTHAETYSNKNHWGIIRTLAISPNKKVYTGGDNSVLKYWNYESDMLKAIKTPGSSRDWILSLDTNADNSYISFGNASGYLHVIINDLIYVKHLQKTILKVKTIQHKDFTLETIALIKDVGIAFIPTDNMTIDSDEKMHTPKRH